MASLGTDATIFAIMVFVAVVLLGSAVIVPTVGSQAQASRRMKQRIFSVLESIDQSTASILRQRYLDTLTPLDRALDRVPGMAGLRTTVEQSGVETKAYKIVLYAIALGLIAWFLMSAFNESPIAAIAVALIVAVMPIVWIIRKRNARLAKFEEQLPDALTMMGRALQAGHPFNETIKMVAEEMKDPIGTEFEALFNDINFGMSSKAAFMSLLTRVPSLSLNTLVIAVLVQSESGGRLSEILMKIAAVIRSRFKLNRKVRTLSAEGRMSAWVLTLLPFVLSLVIAITTPTYLPRMLDDPIGPKLIMVAFALVIAGILWMRKIIRFKF